MSLTLSGVTFAWPDQDPVLSGISLVFETGWTAVLGANGAGKTTLLRLAEGSLRPREGRVRISGDVHLCAQRVDELSDDIMAFSWDYDAVACRWRGRLGLDPEATARWGTLSPGERKRWQIGAALARNPAVLLLDEPTNHLDAGGRRLLVDALSRYGGVGVVVSHDRDFLEALCTRTVVVGGGGARAMSVPPDAAREQLTLEAAERQDRLDRASQLARRARHDLAEQRRRQDAVAAKLSTRARSNGKHDHEARSMGAKLRVQWAEQRAGRQVEVARHRAERLAGALEDVEMPTALGRTIFVRYDPAPKDPVLSLVAEEVRAGNRVVLRDVALALPRGAHVHLAGPNGAGKTTLLQHLLQDHTLPGDRVLALPQELTAEEGEAWLARVRALPSDARGRVMQVVAALGVDPAKLLASTTPSPGEARKLAMAWGLGAHAWVGVLDEPTNHLDLPSIERLEEALTSFPGALLLVTHDARLAAACCTERWRIEDRRVRLEPTGT